MFLSGLFSKYSDTKHSPKKRNSSLSKRKSAFHETSMEQLEQKKLLTVEYYGITHSNIANSTAENYYYQVGVTNEGTGELYIRYNAMNDRLDFDDNQAFTNISTIFQGSSGTASGYHENPLWSTANGNGGFSLNALHDFKSKTLNLDITQEETFTSRSVEITAEDGTSVFLVNGDEFPLGLFIGRTGVLDNRSSSVGAEFANNLVGTASRNTIAGVPSLVEINGPISNTGRANFVGHDTSFDGESIILDAAVSTNGLGLQAGAPQGGLNPNNSQLIELRNTVNSYTDVLVETGTFQVNAGATINGPLDVAVGTDGGGVGRGGFGGNIEINGTVNGSSVTLQTNASDRNTHIRTGPSGVLSGGGSLTLFNAGLDGGTIDVETRNYNVTNVNVGSPTALLPDIGISINQTAGDLTIAAMPSSRGQISLTASGGATSSINVDAGISTAGGLRLDAGTLNINSPLDTEAGNIQLLGNSVTVGSNIHAGSTGVGNIFIESRTAGVTLQSASTIQADTGTISIDAATSISSEATLEAALLTLEAGGLITAGSNSEKLRATAAAGINITADDDMVVELAVTSAGNLDISSQGDLDVQSVSALGAGNVGLIGGSGVTVNRLRTANGQANVSTATGNINIEGEVIVQGDAGDNLTLTADTGNIIVNSSAVVSVADQIILSAEKGRILTPGELVDIEITDPGSGYGAPPIDISIDAGSGATAAPTLTNGGVASIRITNGGSGYVTRPSITLIGGGGTNASAEAVISNGVVTSVNLTNVGSSYTSAPQVVFSGGSGQGAVAEALIDGVLNISVTTSGSGYQTPPEVIISAGEGATTGGVTVSENGEITGIHLGSPGFDYGVAPNVVITDASGAGSGASATANLSTGITSYMINPSGNGYATPPTVTTSVPAGPNPSPAVITANIAGPLDRFDNLGNGFNGINLTAAGDGYTEDVRVVIAGDGQGATATVQIDGSVGGTAGVTAGNNFDGSLSIDAAGAYSVVPDPAGPQQWLDITAQAETLANTDAVNLTPSYGLRSAALQFTAGNKTFAFATWTGPIPNGPGTPASGFMTLSDTGVPDGFETGFGFNPGSGYDGSEWFDAVTGDPVELTVTGGGASGTGTDTKVTILPNRAFELVGGSWTLTGTNDGLREDQDFAFTGNGISGDTQGRINLEVSGEIDGATLALQTAGTGYTTPPTVTFADDFHVGPSATAQTFINGSVTSLNILQPGSGYTPAATITIAPGAGTQAQATPRLSQVVGSISVNQAGENYNPATTTVQLEVVSGGIGAVVSPVQVDNGGGILGINVSTPGIDYVTPPTVVINDLSGAGEGATADALLGIGLVVVDNAGAGYAPGPITATVTASPTGNPADDATVSADVNTTGEIDPSTITFTPGTGYTSAPTITFTGGTTPAVISAYMQVVEINVSAPGEDYDATQTVVELVTAGSGAKAVANLDGSGALASVTMVSSGSGYTVDPIVRIDGYGSNAVAEGNIVGGIVDSTTITQPGSNYAVPPVVTFDTGLGVTATGNAIIGNIATVSGNRLSWTALETPISAFVSQFNTIEVNLTGTGDLLLEADAGSLTIEGASTKDGSVTISAPSLTIAGDINVGDYDSSRDHVISLSATAGDLAIDAQVGNLLEGTLNRTPLSTDIQLSAVSGGIITNNSSGPGLLVSDSLSFSAQDSVLLNTDVNSITSGVVSDSRANVAITQTTLDASGDVLDLSIDSLTAAGGVIEVIAGANIELDIVDAGTTGAIELAAAQDIKESSTGDLAADIIANSVLLYATTGNIDLDSEVAFLTAAAVAGSVTISQNDPDKNPIDGVTDTLEILRILSRDAITIDATSPIKANYIEATNGGLTLTTDNALHTSESFDVQLGNVASPQFINVEADGSVSSFEPDFSEPVITPPAPPPPVAPAFSISFDFDASLPASVANASNAAGLRWSEIIVGDLNPFVDPNTGDVIDDIEIRVQPGLLGGGDAPGGTLANARPLAFRPDTGLPYLGEVGVDLNDINNPELVAIMIHEFGHALGMPGASSFQTFIVGDYFTGPNAVREYESIFGASADTNGVPLETTGGGGTAGAHWSEAEFGNELMTGFLGATNLISTVTVGAFEDVGYDVDYTAADPYTASSNVHGISSPDMSSLRPCGCAFCQPVNSSSLSSSSLEQEQVITTPTLRVAATGTGETIDIHTDVTTFAGSADGNITIQEANTISLGETTPGSLFRDVVSTSGSITVTAAGRITANDVQATDPTNGALNFTSTGSGVTLGAINTQTTTVNASGDVSDVIDLQVTGFVNLAGGNGYTPSSTTIPVTFSASPTGDTATGMATSNGAGEITGITITNPGSGYTTTPTIVIDEPTTGTRATATAVTTGGNRVITSPTLVVHANGSPILLGTNSHVVDTLSATSDTFTRATGTTTLSSTGDADFVDSAVITNGASGYSPNATNIPVTFEASPTGDTATGYAIADAGGVVTGVTTTSPGSGYVTAPTITFASTVHALATVTLGTDEVASATVDFSGSGYTPLTNIPVTFEASPTSDTATGYATADSNGEIVSLTITHSGSGYVSTPLVVVDPPATSGDSLLRGNIEFKTTNGLIIDTVVGKEISLTADDTVTDLNYIIGDALTVTSLTGKDITLANLDNQIAAFGAVTDDSAGTKGDVTLTSTLQNVTLTGITADNIDILVYGNVNDSDATDGTALSIVAGGTVELDTATNDIDTLSVVDTAVDTVTINNGGSGYTPGAVAVTFAPPPITNIVIGTPGSGYATKRLMLFL